MEKPQMKHEVSILTAGTSCIILFATKDALADLQQYGQLLPLSQQDEYMLSVDARFDFAEVVAWIKETWK